MNLTALKNENGSLSGILIPRADLYELKNSVKSDTPLYDYLNDLLSLQENQNPEDILLSNGLTIDETNRRSALLTEELYKNAFEKGVSMIYRDERTKAPDEFIRANPDGSEDLVAYDLGKRNHILIKKLIPPGKGYWAYLIPAETTAHETGVHHSGRSQRGR